MKSITKSIVLTGVLGFFCSVSWGQASSSTPAASTPAAGTGTTAQNCANLKAQKELLSRKYSTDCGNQTVVTTGNNAAAAASNPDRSKNCDGLNSQITSIESQLTSCEEDRTERKEFCKSTVDGINKRLENFPYEAQIQVANCMGGLDESEAEIGASVLRAMSGQYAQYEEKCSASGTKGNYQDQLEKKMREIERIEKELKKIDEDMIKQQKKTAEDLKKMEDDRVDLQQENEKTRTENQNKMQRAINEQRENQIKTGDAIVKGEQDLTKARQALAKATIARKDALFQKGLNSFRAMKISCDAKVRKFCSDKDNKDVCKKKTSKSLSGLEGRGSNKVGDIQSVWNECLEEKERQREELFATFADQEMNLLNEIQAGDQKLKVMQTEQVRLQQQFETMIQRMQTEMNQAEVAFNQKFAVLGQQIVQYQQTSQQEAIQMQQQKMKLQQDLMAAQTSRGKINSSEVRQGVANLRAHKADIDSLATRCPNDHAKYKGQIDEIDRALKAADEATK
jgi:hypothetical protein